MHGDCLFCAMAGDSADPSIVAMDDLTLTLVHRGQWRHAHFLVAPRQHIVDIRDMDDTLVEALMRAVTRVAQAIDTESPGEQISIWKSGSHAAGARHVHFHVHPRRLVRTPSPEHEDPYGDLSDAAASRWRMRLASVPVVADHRPLVQHPIADCHAMGDRPDLTASNGDFAHWPEEEAWHGDDD